MYKYEIEIDLKKRGFKNWQVASVMKAMDHLGYSYKTYDKFLTEVEENTGYELDGNSYKNLNTEQTYDILLNEIVRIHY